MKNIVKSNFAILFFLATTACSTLPDTSNEENLLENNPHMAEKKKDGPSYLRIQWKAPAHLPESIEMGSREVFMCTSDGELFELDVNVTVNPHELTQPIGTELDKRMNAFLDRAPKVFNNMGLSITAQELTDHLNNSTLAATMVEHIRDADEGPENPEKQPYSIVVEGNKISTRFGPKCRHTEPV